MSQNERGYNGWTNYETWAVNLWIGNEEPSYRHWNAMAQQVWNEAEPNKAFTREERATITLANTLKSSIGENNVPRVKGVYSDLLSAAISEVNWHEIASGLIESVNKD